MTPKGLLRLKQASSTLADLAEGTFRQVIDDPAADREQVRRLVVCSGKVYYDIAGHELRAGASQVAALPVPRRRVRPADRELSPARRGRLGAGGTAEHGCLAHDPPPSRGAAPRGGHPAQLCRQAVAGEPERGLSDGAPA